MSGLIGTKLSGLIVPMYLSRGQLRVLDSRGQNSHLYVQLFSGFDFDSLIMGAIICRDEWLAVCLYESHFRARL